MTNSSDSVALKRIEKIQKSANALATSHGVLEDFYNFVSGFFLASNLIIPLFLVVIALASEPLLIQIPYVWILHADSDSDRIKLNAALYAAFCFLTAILDLIIKPQERANIHKNAVDHYAKAKFRLRDLRESADARKLSEQQIRKASKKIQRRYLDRTEIPAIAEALFLPLRFWHELKMLTMDAMTAFFDWLNRILLRRPRRTESPDDNPAMNQQQIANHSYLSLPPQPYVLSKRRRTS